MHDHFGHYGIGKTYSLIKRYYHWPKMIRHIQAHADSCSLCRREKMQADKHQSQTTEIPKRTFVKVSIDLIVEMPTSHYGNKYILVMVNHLTSWQMVKAIPDKEATTVANAIFKKNMGVQKSFCLIMGKNSQMSLWPISARSLGLSNILLPLILPGQMERQRILINYSRSQ